MSEYNYTYATPTSWQAWHEAYFDRVGGVLQANGEWVRLLNSGCTTDSWATPNCTRTCSNATAMFSSPENVWNCMALATVTMEVVQGSKTVDPSNLRKMDDIFDLGGSLEAFDKLRVFASVRQCFWQSCSDSKYGNCTSSLTRFRCDHIDSDNIEDFASVIRGSYCQGAALGVDSDIAGPGILVAYMFQISLVLILAGIFWFTYQPYSSFKTAARQLRSGFSGASKRPEETGPPSLETLDSKPAGRFTIAVHSTVADLQKAQTAFGLTIGVIFLFAFAGESKLGLANVSSVLSYTINRDIAFGLSVVGMCSIVFLQPCRQRVGKRGKSRLFSMVPMVLSWILMSIAHGFKARGAWADPKKFLETLKENAAVEDCGNNPGPMSFCLGPLLQGPDQSQQVFSLTIKLTPVVHCLSAIVLFEEYIVLRRGKSGSKISRSLSGRFGQILTFIPLAAKLLGLSMLVICLIDVVKAFIKIRQINGGQHSWGFGQLAAMAVWIPVVVNLLIFLAGMLPLHVHEWQLTDYVGIQLALRREQKPESTANFKCPG